MHPGNQTKMDIPSLHFAPEAVIPGRMANQVYSARESFPMTGRLFILCSGIIGFQVRKNNRGNSFSARNRVPVAKKKRILFKEFCLDLRIIAFVRSGQFPVQKPGPVSLFFPVSFLPFDNGDSYASSGIHDKPCCESL